MLIDTKNPAARFIIAESGGVPIGPLAKVDTETMIGYPADDAPPVTINRLCWSLGTPTDLISELCRLHPDLAVVKRIGNLPPFRCAKCRQRDEHGTGGDGYVVHLTGQAKANSRGLTIKTKVMREYVCDSCGHKGWSIHVDLERHADRCSS